MRKTHAQLFLFAIRTLLSKGSKEYLVIGLGNHGLFCIFFGLRTSSPKKFDLEVAGQTLDCYCVCCELSASKADALRFVNMVCLPLIAEQNAHEICLTQEHKNVYKL